MNFFTEKIILECLNYNKIEYYSSWKETLVIENTNENFVIEYKIKDLYELNKKGGLKQLVLMLGIPNHKKYDLDESKQNMEIRLKDPEFIQQYFYDHMEDGKALAKVNYINKIQTETLKMYKSFEFKENSIPISTGKLITKMFRNYLYNAISREKNNERTNSRDKVVNT